MDLKQFLADFYKFATVYGKPRNDESYMRNLMEASRKLSSVYDNDKLAMDIIIAYIEDVRRRQGK